MILCIYLNICFFYLSGDICIGDIIFFFIDFICYNFVLLFYLEVISFMLYIFKIFLISFML